MTLVLSMLAGGVGAVLRYLLMLWIPATLMRFPLALAVANTLGSFFIMLAAANTTAATHEILTTGLLGGFTTFSAASHEAAVLWQAGRRVHAAWLSAILFGLACAGALLGWLCVPHVFS